MAHLRSLVSLVASLACVTGCGPAGHVPADGPGSESDPFASNGATLIDLDFDGELTTGTSSNTTSQIKSQILYTVGQLNASSSVSRLSKLSLSNVTVASVGGGLFRIRYHAKLPVAWGAKSSTPQTVVLTLPRRVDASGIASFASKYAAACQGHDGHDVNASNFWFHYRPAASGCALAPSDVVTIATHATKSAKNSTGKYPEFHRVWEDGVLRVVAVFGKFASGATGADDAGIDAYDAFVEAVRAALPNAATTPSTLSGAPGAASPDVTIEGELADGRQVIVTVLLVDELRYAPASFDKRFAELTPGADVITYNGHAGLGANVAALATKGAWFPGKYQILFVNGCDTFAYQDDTLAKTRAAVNPDDPSGTKYLDVITNAMPAYFSSMPNASMSLMRALWSEPKPYEAIFQDVDPAQVVVVDGEQDNVFSPTMESPTLELIGSGSVAYKETMSWQTDLLPAGKYAFEMTAEPGAPGGDADLRVRAGSAPDGGATYKCPSYHYNSNERCVLTLATPSHVFVTATGDKSSQASSFLVRGFSL